LLCIKLGIIDCASVSEEDLLNIQAGRGRSHCSVTCFKSPGAETELATYVNIVLHVSAGLR